ncbi:MAG: hypothetical protein AAGH82_02160 [Pseudomonadota bacterium]
MSKPNSLSYRTSAAFAATVFAVLAACLWGAPDVLHTVLGLEGTDDAELVMGRAGVLFAAFASLLWASRSEEPSYLRTQIAFSVLLAMLGLVLFGLVEWLSGRVGPGIAFAIAVELLIASMFLPHAKGGDTMSANNSGEEK